MIANDSNKPLTNVCNRNVDNNKGCELQSPYHWKIIKMGILLKINNTIIEMNILQQKKPLLKVYVVFSEYFFRI